GVALGEPSRVAFDSATWFTVESGAAAWVLVACRVDSLAVWPLTEGAASGATIVGPGLIGVSRSLGEGPVLLAGSGLDGAMSTSG
ncbi:MAG: hypothetical protein WBC80_27625, partial [Isosphaeraceae bacterium]